MLYIRVYGDLDFIRCAVAMECSSLEVWGSFSNTVVEEGVEGYGHCE